jgi:hypothetical protein
MARSRKSAIPPSRPRRRLRLRYQPQPRRHWPIRLANAPGVSDMLLGSILMGTIIYLCATGHILRKGSRTRLMNYSLANQFVSMDSTGPGSMFNTYAHEQKRAGCLAIIFVLPSRPTRHKQALSDADSPFRPAGKRFLLPRKKKPRSQSRATQPKEPTNMEAAFGKNSKLSEWRPSRNHMIAKYHLFSMVFEFAKDAYANKSTNKSGGG